MTEVTSELRRGYRWVGQAAEPLTVFASPADALAAAAFASDLPLGCDTLHLVHRAADAVEVIAATSHGEPRWLHRR